MQIRQQQAQKIPQVRLVVIQFIIGYALTTCRKCQASSVLSVTRKEFKQTEHWDCIGVSLEIDRIVTSQTVTQPG